MSSVSVFLPLWVIKVENFIAVLYYRSSDAVGTSVHSTAAANVTTLAASPLTG